jgi:signal peptidase II
MRNLRWLWVLLIATIVVALDQWTKGLVEAQIPLWQGIAPFPALAQYFNIVHWQNSGAAFGILRGQAGLFIVVAIVVVVILLIYSRYITYDSWWMRLALGLQLGGAVGNLIDRLTQNGLVTDFLLFQMPVGNRVYQWPAWNVADASIVVGTILLAILLLRADSQNKEAPTSAKASGSEAAAAKPRETEKAE